MSTNPYYGQEGHGPYELIGIGNLELMSPPGSIATPSRGR